MDSTAHWPQGIGVVKTMDQASSKQPNNNLLERRTRPQKDQALNCPRCNSTNTKFCYYNNYSLTQPRYFCKTCRRYWTEGGSLRNVPVGGGSRKNKRSSSSSSISSSSLPISSSAPKKLADHHHHHHTVPVPPSLNFPPPHQNPKLIHQGQDLNLTYPPTSTHHDHQDFHHHDHHHNSNISRSPFVEVPYNSTGDIHQNKSHELNPCSTTTTSAMELLKTGINYNASSTHGLISSLMSMPVQDSNTMFSTGFPNLAQEFKPSLSFGLDHGYNNNHDHHDRSYDRHGPVQESGARLLFPSDQDLKQVSSTTTTTSSSDQDHHHHHHHQFELNKGQRDISNGYNWNGMLGHGGSW